MDFCQKDNVIVNKQNSNSEQHQLQEKESLKNCSNDILLCESPIEDTQLLLTTLNGIWFNYLQANNADTEEKQHWMSLFLFHFKLIDVEEISRHAALQKQFETFFNFVPQGVCSYLLEQVYEIICKSDLYLPEKVNCTQTNNNYSNNAEFCDNESQGNHYQKYTAAEIKQQQHKPAFARLLSNERNFAQLILNGPNDCNKIVALRNFLTNQLGHHLLEFLLNVDTKFLASRQSLCNLCINLFPNCPWGSEYEPLKSPATLLEHIGEIYLLTTKHRRRDNAKILHINNKNIKDYNEKKLKNCEKHRIEKPNIYRNCDRSNADKYAFSIKTASGDAVDAAVAPARDGDEDKEAKRRCPGDISFKAFKSAVRTSDEIACMLIRLLKKCITADEEKALNAATTHNEQMVTLTALKFALDTLANAMIWQQNTFGSWRNVAIIKCELLGLIEKCLNKLFTHISSTNEMIIRLIDDLDVLSKLLSVLDDHNAMLSSALDDLQRKPNAAVESKDLHAMYMVGSAITYICFGIMHNYIAAAMSLDEAASSNRHSHGPKHAKLNCNLLQKLAKKNVDEFCLIQSKLSEDSAISEELNLISMSVINVLIRINDNFSHERLQKQQQQQQQQQTHSAGNNVTNVPMRKTSQTNLANNNVASSKSGNGNRDAENRSSYNNGSSSSQHRQTSLLLRQRRKRAPIQQIHCQNNADSNCESIERPDQQSLSCYFQGLLLRLMSTSPAQLQMYIMRYYLTMSPCCCHYSLTTLNVCLGMLKENVPAERHKCVYQFMQRVLYAIFANRTNFDTLSNSMRRPDSSGDKNEVETAESQSNKIADANTQKSCCNCDNKLKSLEFHNGILEVYRRLFEHINLQQDLLYLTTITKKLSKETVASYELQLQLFLKHLKHVATFLTNDIVSAILAEFILPIFRKFKAALLTSTNNLAANAKDDESPTLIYLTLDYIRSILLECLNIFIIYLNDIRLIKAFYNEENIRHLSDLFDETGLVRGVCDLIKIGIDNITFLGDNAHEQITLSRLLITLQLQGSEDSVAYFDSLLKRLIRIENQLCDQHPEDQYQHENQSFKRYESDEYNALFYLSENNDSLNDINIADNSKYVSGFNQKPIDLLNNLASHWALNYDLLKTNQYFYNAFAQVYSIDDPEENEADDSKLSQLLASRSDFKPIDKTIIDILKLNYNALSAFLLLPPHQSPRKARQSDTFDTVDSSFNKQHSPQYIYTFVSSPNTSAQSTPTSPMKSPDQVAEEYELNQRLESLLDSIQSSNALFTSGRESQPFTSVLSGHIANDEPVNVICPEQQQQIDILRQLESHEDDANVHRSAFNRNRTSLTNFKKHIENVNLNESISIYSVRRTMSSNRLENSIPFPSNLTLTNLSNSLRSNETDDECSVLMPTLVSALLSSSFNEISMSFHSLNEIPAGHQNNHHHHQHYQNPLWQTSSDVAAAVAYGSVNVLGKLFNMFGSILSGFSRSNSLNPGKPKKPRKFINYSDIGSDLMCFYETQSDCKKFLLKIFEATMGICIRGFHNEDTEKMEKHLRKLRALILNHAETNWQQHSEELSRDNLIIQTLQTLLKIAEQSSGLNNETLTAAKAQKTSAATLNDTKNSSDHNRTPQSSLQQPLKSITSTTTRERRNTQPLQQNIDLDEKAGRRNSLVRRANSSTASANAESEIEISDNDEHSNSPENSDDGQDASLGDIDEQNVDNSQRPSYRHSKYRSRDNNYKSDYYFSDADEGYEADGEILEESDSDTEIIVNDVWNPLQPASRYRSHILHEGLCGLVVDLLMELSKLCIQNPLGWNDSLAQLAYRLHIIRNFLGGPLFLLRGFRPVLECNDIRLRELQQAILELVTDFNSPDILCTYFGILSSRNPPIDILMKYMSCIILNSLRKPQPTVELAFPVGVDGKCISTSDENITQKIDCVRNYHLHNQTMTPFTRAPCIIPITHSRLWNGDGFTLSTWIQVKSTPKESNGFHRNSSQIIDDDGRSTTTSADDSVKTHILSIGTNQAMLSIYVNSNMNLAFETIKPNAEMVNRSPTGNPIEERESSTQQEIGREALTRNSKGQRESNKNPETELAQNSNSITGPSPLRSALKQTKMVLLNSFSNMHIFNAHGNTNRDSYLESDCVKLKYHHITKNKWTHFVFVVEPQAENLKLIVYIDGLEHHELLLPFRNLRNLTRSHDFQLISLGDSGVVARSSANSSSHSCNNDSHSTLHDNSNGSLSVGFSNLMLFNRRIKAIEAIFTLTAMGPDFVDLTQCQIMNFQPNYGYLNLSKMHNANFGNFIECMRLLKDAHVLTYSAQQPDIVMGYETIVDLDSNPLGRPYGLILYGQLIQNEIPSIQISTILSGGLPVLAYLFARVNEITNNAVVQSMALDVLLSVAQSDSQLYAEFTRSDYTDLIGHVIKTERCSKDLHLLKSIVNNSCTQPLIVRRNDALFVNENTNAILVYPRLFIVILRRYSDWHRSGCENSEVLDMYLQCVLALTREKHQHRDFNMEQLNRCGLFKELLNLCKVYMIESPNPIYISEKAARLFVDIIAVFAGSPPQTSLLDEIMKLLLLLHKPSECYITHDRAKYYFLMTAHPPPKERSLGTVNLSRVAAPFRRNAGRPHSGTAAPPPANSTETDSHLEKAQNAPTLTETDSRSARINRLRKFHLKQSGYKQVIHDFEENLENIADCSKLNKNAMKSLSPIEVGKWRKKYKRYIANHTNSSSSSTSGPAALLSSAKNLGTNELDSPLRRYGSEQLPIKRKTRSSLSNSSSATSVGAIGLCHSPQHKIAHRRLRIRPSYSSAGALYITEISSGKANYSGKLPKRHILYTDSSANCLRSSSSIFIADCQKPSAENRFSGSSNSSSSTAGANSTNRRSKHLPAKIDFYNTPGIVALQEGLLTLLKGFLFLLPDNAVDEVIKHYVKFDYLLVLSNHSSCSIRAAVVRLLIALTQRMTHNDLQQCHKNFYPQHLANQLSIHVTDGQIFEACVQWVTDTYANSAAMLTDIPKLCIHQRTGLSALLAVSMKLVPNHLESSIKAFRIFNKIFNDDSDENRHCLIENGLIQCSVKTLHSFSLHQHATKAPSVTNTLAKNSVSIGLEESVIQLLTSIGAYSLKSVGPINIVWDVLNLLAFYQENQQAHIIRSFRSVQAHLQLNWIKMFFNETDVPSNYKVVSMAGCSLTLSETRTRLGLLIDRCFQFFTVFDANYVPSTVEIKLFQFLVSYGISTNQRCNNFIAWGLQPSRPQDLREFIVKVLWNACQDDFQPAIICDGKMIKSLLWLSLLEDLAEPIENLDNLCKHLGINEHDSVWNLESELERIESNRCAVSARQKNVLEKSLHKFESLAVSCIETSMVITRRVAEIQNAERKSIISQMKDYDETNTYTKWLQIINRMTHEGAPWFCKERSVNSWELDATEGPSRVHTRLRRCHLDIDRRFIKEDYCSRQTESNKVISKNHDMQHRHEYDEDYLRPLDYLISSYDQQLNISLNSQILYNFPAKYLPVDGEIDGEIVISDHKLYFLATSRLKYFYVTCEIANITEIWLKRYQHQEKAFEIFLDTNQSLFFTLQNQDDWKIMREIFCDKIATQPDQAKIALITQQWREGLFTNWEYLMILNQYAGRTYNDLMQYPVFPWILANYTGDALDLTEITNFRKLEKPIAVQHEENEQHYINNYNYINSTMTNMGSLILKPYHYSSHYSNSGTVLHFLVRVPPFTSYFLRYQDNNFDLPDRTFHSLSTTWKLASHDSPTDVKELIPEFFCLPEMFENFENFNFGCRQNGERVDDVTLPPWCQRDPRLFVLIHRQALECEIVRKSLHQWIDLIFGFKQIGENAVQAINVFHPATYSIFLQSEIFDPIERRAVETMVKTYGQMPRQLFKTAHPASKSLNYCLVDQPTILRSIRGLRWGVYLGSPQLGEPELGPIRKLPGAELLVSFNNTNVVYGLPAKSCVMQGTDLDTYNIVSWGYDDQIVRIQPLNKGCYTRPKSLLRNSSLDSITACGADPNSNQLWLGHRSGRLTVYKCSNGDAKSRTVKSRQSYVRGFRLSYNSALRKITSASTASSSTAPGILLSSSKGFKGTGEIDMEGGEVSVSSLSTSSIGSIGGDAMSLNMKNNESFWSDPAILVRHTDEITCICISVDFKIAVSAGRDGIAVIWDLNDWSYIRTIERPAEIHHSPITLVAISPTLGDIVTVHSMPRQVNLDATPTRIDQTTLSNSTPKVENTNRSLVLSPNKLSIGTMFSNSATPADECFEVTEENLGDFVNVCINPNGKAILRLHTVNARYIQHIVNEESIHAICYSYIKEGVGVNVIATAIEGGIIRLWSSWNLSLVREIPTGTTNIRSITYSTHQHLVVLTRESHIQVWQTEGLYGNPPKFPQLPSK